MKNVAEMASDAAGGEGLGEVGVMISDTLLRCDDRGRQYLKDEEKARRQSKAQKGQEQSQASRTTGEEEQAKGGEIGTE